MVLEIGRGIIMGNGIDLSELLKKVREKRRQGKVKETILRKMKGIIPNRTKAVDRAIEAAIRG